MIRALILFILFPISVSAQCLTANTGAGCAQAREVVRPPSSNTTVAVRDLGPSPVEIGEILEKGRYSMLMNAPWYGLPPAKDGWVYFRVEDDVFRVDFKTREVLERATAEAGRNWP